jgi:UDP-glucose 4-epimerase
VYGKGVRVPFREDDDRLMGPTSRSRWAYAESKAVDEFLGLAYHHQFGLPVVIMRFFNTVGPRQTGRYGMVVPRFVRAALREQPLNVYGDGTQSRCFADVADVTRAIIQLADQPAAVGQVFNIGSTREITIRELAERVVKLTGSRSEIVHVPYEEAYAPGFEDMQRRVPSIDKIAALIDYEPKYTLDDTLLRVIKYEKNLLASGDEASSEGRT